VKFWTFSVTNSLIFLGFLFQNSKKKFKNHQAFSMYMFCCILGKKPQKKKKKKNFAPKNRKPEKEKRGHM
jgi:hypothetical protein